MKTDKASFLLFMLNPFINPSLRIKYGETYICKLNSRKNMNKCIYVYTFICVYIFLNLQENDFQG